MAEQYSDLKCEDMDDMSDACSPSPEGSPARSASVLDMDGANDKASKSKSPNVGARASKAKTPSKPATKNRVSSAQKHGTMTDHCSPPSKTTSSPRKRVADDEDVEDDDDTPQCRAKRSKPTNGQEMIRPSRLMPTFMGGPKIAMATADGFATASGSMNMLNSTVYEVTLGKDFKWHGHENILLKSPRFKEAIIAAKGKKRRGPRQILHFENFDPAAFDLMLNWLYQDKFTLIKSHDIPARLHELSQLMSVAKAFKLPTLQKLVCSSFAKSRLMNRCDISGFFNWAQEMWYNDLDPEDGPFVRFFALEAPKLLQAHVLDITRRDARGKDVEVKSKEETFQELLRQAKDGNEFGGELFKALYQALATTKGHLKTPKDDGEIKEVLTAIPAAADGNVGPVIVKTAPPEDDE